MSFTFLTVELSENEWVGRSIFPLGAASVGNQGGGIGLYKADAWSRPIEKFGKETFVSIRGAACSKFQEQRSDLSTA